MPKSIETQGETVDEAVEAALDELGVERDDVSVEVLEEEAKSGFLGLKRSGKARVRVSVKGGQDLRVERLKGAADRILELMGLRGSVSVSEPDDETLHVEMIGEDDLGILIGRHGQTLEALQTILGVMANKGEPERRRVTLDVEEYRRRRREELESLAERVAEKALTKNEPVVLRPMTPFERKVVHMALHDNPDVETYSEGEEPYRRITVEPRK